MHCENQPAHFLLKDNIIEKRKLKCFLGTRSEFELPNWYISLPKKQPQNVTDYVKYSPHSQGT